MSTTLLGACLFTWADGTAASAHGGRPAPARSDESKSSSRPLSVRVTPPVTQEPGAINVQIVIERDDRHRSFTVEADGTNYFRSSTVPLDGTDAARVFTITYGSLPEGDYAIRVELNGVNRVLDSLVREVKVIGFTP